MKLWGKSMKSFEICKAPLGNNFTGINTKALGQAVSELKHCGLKLYLYLAGNKNGYNWTLNPSAYADWLGVDYSSKGRTVRKAIEDGIADLMVNGYLEVINESEEKYRFLEQKVPKKDDEVKNNQNLEQIVPKKADFTF